MGQPDVAIAKYISSRHVWAIIYVIGAIPFLLLVFSIFTLFLSFLKTFLLFYTFAWCFRGVSTNSCTATHHVCFSFSFLGLFTLWLICVSGNPCSKSWDLLSAFSFWILIPPAICLLGHVRFSSLSCFIAFIYLGSDALGLTSETETIYLWYFSSNTVQNSWLLMWPLSLTT